MSDGRKARFITEARQAAMKVWEGIQELKALQPEWNALDYGGTHLEDSDVVPNLPDGEGDAAGITPAHIASAIFDTADALEGLLNQGHATNLARLL